MGLRPAPVPGVDPLFTDDDAEELLDYLQWKDSICSGCGQPKHESFAVENTWAYDGVVLECHACAAMRRAERRLDVHDGLYSFAEKKA